LPAIARLVRRSTLSAHPEAGSRDAYQSQYMGRSGRRCRATSSDRRRWSAAPRRGPSRRCIFGAHFSAQAKCPRPRNL
jgi:hypothetical protein